MKICYNETLQHSNLAKDIMLCKTYGYDSIEIRIEYLQEYLETHTVEELKNLLAQSGLRPLALNSVDNINFCTAPQWKDILGRFLFACEMCRELDNPYIVVVPTEDEKLSEKHPDEIAADSIEVLRTLSGIATEYGAKLAFEPIGNRRWCVRSIRQASRIIKGVDRDNVGLTIDAMNLYCYDRLKDMDDLREIPKGKIYVFHINDSMDVPIEKLEPEKHRLYPGDGIIPLKKICQLLKEIGYTGPASLELFNPIFEKLDPETFLHEGYLKTRAVLDSLNA